MIIAKGRLTLTQRAYLLGYRRALVRMRRELRGIVTAELAELRETVDGIERDYANAKEVAKAMAERDPEVRLH